MDVPYTPAVVVDLPTVRRNITKLVSYATKHNLKVRPHTKTHKSLRIARMQVEMGCSGLTFAKLGEVQAMGAATDDVLLAYPALDDYRRSHVVEIAKTKTLRIAMDSTVAAERIGAAAKGAGVTIGALADIDTGHHRTGVQSPAELIKLAQFIDKTAGLRLDGIFCYPGHIKGPEAEQVEQLKPVQAILAESLALYKKSGLNAGIVTGGSSPACFLSHHVPAYTEIRPGTNVYNDMNQVDGGVATLDECAARVTCTVISDAVPNKFVLDGGSKTFFSDRNAFQPHSFGYVVEYPGAYVVRFSEEHAEVDASKCDRRPKLGERVTVIPNHVCPCVNLHDYVFFREADGSLEKSPVDARGKIV